MFESPVEEKCSPVECRANEVQFRSRFMIAHEIAAAPN